MEIKISGKMENPSKTLAHKKCSTSVKSTALLSNKNLKPLVLLFWG